MSLGRPSKFNDRIKEKMISLYEQGKTDDQVAEVIGVCVKTIQNWKGKHEDFLHALRESKQIADELVEASLFSRAVGYTHPEEKIFQYEGEIVRAETSKHYPPDVSAATTWLQNRNPDRWKNKQTVEHEGSVSLKIDLEEKIKQLKGENSDDSNDTGNGSVNEGRDDETA